MTTPPSPARLLADADALLLDILIADTSLGADHVGETLPASYLNLLPFALAYRWGGSAVHPEFLDTAVCDVHVYAATRSAALDLGEACRVALYRAWQRQTVYPHGSVASYEEQAAPAALRTTPADGITVVQATYRLGLCPPPRTS